MIIYVYRCINICVYIYTHTFRYYSFIDVLVSVSLRMCGCVLLHEQYLQSAVYSFPGIIKRRNMYTCWDRFLIFNAATDGFYYYAANH